MDLLLYPIVNDKVYLYYYPNNDIYAIIVKKDGKRSSYKLSSNALNVLQICDGTKNIENIVKRLNVDYEINEEEFAEFIEASINNGILELSKEPHRKKLNIIGDGKSILPKHATIEITNQCNLKCTYCYNECSPSKKEILTIDKADNLFRLLSSNGVHVVEISGGEPMIHPDITQILELAFKYFEWVAILSNGVFIKDEVIELVKEYKDKFAGMQISIDGSNDKISKKLRQVSGTFEKSIDNIKKLIENNVFVRAAIVLTDDNIGDLRNTCELMKNIGVKSFGISVAEEWGRGNELLDSVSNNKYSYRYNFKQKYEKELTEIFNDYEDIITNRKIFNKLDMAKTQNCGAGWSSLTITPSGNVKTCPTSNIYIGNIFEEEYHSLLNNEKTRTMYNFSIQPFKDKICSKCDYFRDCSVCFSKIYNTNRKRLKNGEGICEVFRLTNLDSVFNL